MFVRLTKIQEMIDPDTKSIGCIDIEIEGGLSDGERDLVATRLFRISFDDPRTQAIPENETPAERGDRHASCAIAMAFQSGIINQLRDELKEKFNLPIGGTIFEV